MYFQTKPDTIWIPIGLKRKVWFGNTLDFPSHTTSGFLLANKNKVWFDNLLGCPSHLTMVHAPFVNVRRHYNTKIKVIKVNMHNCYKITKD